MTANEMKYSFLVEFDSLFEYTAPSYDDKQISYLLTEAQRRIFLRKYNPFANKYRKGFESDEQRRRELDQLIRPGLYNSSDPTGASTPDGVESVTYDSTKQSGVHPNGIFLDMPDNFLYAIEESVLLTGATKESKVKPVKHDEYFGAINNPYKKPYQSLIWRMDISRFQQETVGQEATKQRVELVLPDDSSLDIYRVRYLSTPPPIVCDEIDPTNQVNCILNEIIHGEIVSEAVTIAKAPVKPDEYQIGVTEQERNN